jgi:hypothetical protein
MSEKKITVRSFFLLAIIFYILLWVYAFIQMNEQMLDRLAKISGKLIFFGFIILVYYVYTYKNKFEKNLLYLKKYFKNKLSPEQEKQLLECIRLLHSRKIDEARSKFKTHNIENFSEYFISFIDIQSNVNIDVSKNNLEEIIKKNDIHSGFGDLFYLLSLACLKLNEPCKIKYDKLFEEGEKYYFK